MNFIAQVNLSFGVPVRYTPSLHGSGGTLQIKRRPPQPHPAEAVPFFTPSLPRRTRARGHGPPEHALVALLQSGEVPDRHDQRDQGDEANPDDESHFHSRQLQPVPAFLRRLTIVGTRISGFRTVLIGIMHGCCDRG